MCKLECPCLYLYLFVTLGEWFITGRKQPVLADMRGYCWEPGGHCSALPVSDVQPFSDDRPVSDVQPVSVDQSVFR